MPGSEQPKGIDWRYFQVPALNLRLDDFSEGDFV
jgi:hypothetical protein